MVAIIPPWVLLSAPYALHANTAKDLSEVPDIVTMAIKDTASQIRTAFQTAANTVNQAISTNSQAIKDTASQIRAAITNELPTSGNTGDMAYWDGTQWVAIPAGGEGQVLTFKNGAPVWEGLLEGEVLSNTGKIWMDRNLGASQVAISELDTDAFGDLYQWGRGTDGHEKRTSGTTTTLANSDTPEHGDFIIPSTPYDWRNPQNDNLWQGVDGTNNPCPEGYRIPTAAEWEAEVATWSSQNAVGAFESPLKLPTAGGRYYAGNIATGFTNYWSSTVVGSDVYIMSPTTGTGIITLYRAYGLPVRCIKD